MKLKGLRQSKNIQDRRDWSSGPMQMIPLFQRPKPKVLKQGRIKRK